TDLSMTRIVKFSDDVGFTFACGDDWEDTTDELDTPTRPFTLTKPTGVGALQFSVALYQGGTIPAPSLDTLLEMAKELGERQALGPPIRGLTTVERPLSLATADYHSEGDFCRIWYISDGKSIMLATYVCCWEHRHFASAECNAIVRSVRFET